MGLRMLTANSALKMEFNKFLFMAKPVVEKHDYLKNI